MENIDVSLTEVRASIVCEVVSRGYVCGLGLIENAFLTVGLS